MIQSICVCGAGTMGSGIALLAASHGLKTTLYDVQEKITEQAKVVILKNLQVQVEKGKIDQGKKDSILAAINFSSQIKDCSAQIVIEAIIEKKEAKQQLFEQLVSINPPSTILATNTSSLSVSELAKGIPNPERFAGMHFFNPPFIMKLVEVVKGELTSQETIDAISNLAKQLGRTPVTCKDEPGFIVNHVARPYYLESLRLVEMGYADVGIMDTLLEGSGFKMGPFRLMDLIGNDINYSVSCSVYEQLGKPPRLQPSTIQQQKVELGHLGRKSGKGYYEY